MEVHAVLVGSAEERLVEVAMPDTLRLPIYDLEPDVYDLQVRLLSGNTLQASVSRPIRVLPRVAHEWRVDERGALRHNGEPVLPFGWFSMPPEVVADTSNAYNLVQSYHYTTSTEDVRAILDRAAAAGTAVLLRPYPGGSFLHPASVWSQPLSESEAAALRQRVRALKDHPGLFAWYMADEPELRPALPARCEQIYQVVREEDTYHPCVMLNDTMEGIRRYRDGGDVLMPDPYPGFLQGGRAALPIEKVGRFIATATDAAAGQLHVVSEERVVSLRDGVLHDRFAPYATHIYSTRPVAVREPLAAVQRRIAAADAARPRPGAYGRTATPSRPSWPNVLRTMRSPEGRWRSQ